MRVFINIVVLSLAVGLTLSKTDTYKAAVISESFSPDAYAPIIREAAKSNVDILVLPPPNVTNTLDATTPGHFDNAVRAISAAAKEHGLYVVSQLVEKMRCKDTTELVRTNLVFNRQGSIISVYKKPIDPTARCNKTAAEIGSFITDFGVTFGVLMAEDLVLQDLGAQDARNFVLMGTWKSEIPVLAPPQFFSSWAYTTGSNLLSTAGIFSGKGGAIGNGKDLRIAELKKDGEAVIRNPATTVKTYSEDLNQYIIRPLDLAASSKGIKETVCHGEFCCRFFVKTSSIGPQDQESVNYCLAAFEGIRHFGSHHHIGVQNCAILPCAGSYKRSSDVGAVNNTNLIFDEISITGNFKDKNSAQFPVILSTDSLSSRFQFTKSVNRSEVTVKLYDSQKLLNFGIFGRVFTKDFESKDVAYSNTEGVTYNIYDYIKDDVIDFFDYLWITFRIPIFVISIYVLEMM